MPILIITTILARALPSTKKHLLNWALNGNGSLLPLKDYPDIIELIAKEKDFSNKTPVVFNLCDGDEINGTPGISVVRLLEEKGLIYTGADEYFYHITTSKIPMKQAFDRAKVPSAKWKAINDKDQNLNNIFEKLGYTHYSKAIYFRRKHGCGYKECCSQSN